MSAAEKLHIVKNALLGRTYELSLTRDYVSRWGMPQAVRELIQNAIDSGSPFKYEFIPGENGQTLVLNSEFSVLTPQCLLLGYTSKAQDEDAIGSFGEGFKLALLVLVRENYKIEIYNGDVIWSPYFKHSKIFNADILAIGEYVMVDKLYKGLTVLVHGLDEQAVESIKASCLFMQDNIGAIRSTQYGDILLEQKGKLYVGSLFICDTDLNYGYNIKPKYLRLERDRQTVHSWDLRSTTIKCWFDLNEPDRVAQMIMDQVPDVSYAEYGSPEIVKEACYNLFKKMHPGHLIASSPQDLKDKIEQGLTRTVYAGSVMFNAVSGSSAYKAEVRGLAKPRHEPHTQLTEFLSAHRDEMRRPAIVAFKELIAEAKRSWKLS
jgi:hypothetical protein